MNDVPAGLFDLVTGGPRRASPVMGATFVGRYKRAGNAWFDRGGNEIEFETRKGSVYGCYEVNGGYYDVYAEPKVELSSNSIN